VLGPAMAAAKLTLFYNEAQAKKVQSMQMQAEATKTLRTDMTRADVMRTEAEAK